MIEWTTSFGGFNVTRANEVVSKSSGNFSYVSNPLPKWI